MMDSIRKQWNTIMEQSREHACHITSGHAWQLNEKTGEITCARCHTLFTEELHK